MNSNRNAYESYASLFEYNLALKRLEIWQHLEFIRINLQFFKGSFEDRVIWKQKTPVLQALLKYSNDKNIYALYDVINRNELYAKGWFSKTDVFVKELMDLVGKAPSYEYHCKIKAVAADDFERIQKVIIVNNISGEFKDIDYDLAKKKVEILFHLGTLNLNYDKGNAEEQEVWNQKTAVLRSLLKFIEHRNINVLNDVIAHHPLHAKGWFSKTDVYVKDVMDLVRQLPQKKNVLTNTNQHFFQPVPVLTEEERQIKMKEQDKQLDDMLEDAQRLTQEGTIINRKLNGQYF